MRHFFLRKLPWLLAFACAPALAAAPPPAGLKVAFIGDQGLGPASVAVLQLIEDEGADAVIHAGDFDYGDDPAAWDAQIDATLGSGFPYFALIGNHDDIPWYTVGGYQERIAARMVGLGIPWEGDLGVKSTIHWQGLHIVMTAPGIFELGDPTGEYEDYVRDEFAGSDSVWRISTWHKLMRDMQVGAKIDETGWGVYEASREAGAIVATAHEHSYSRTHLMSDFDDQVIASTGDPLVLAADDPGTGPDEGRSFAFVSGLAGRSIRNQVRSADWWASVYTGTQDATDGALFAVFHVGGNPRLASFYFKDVDGNVIDTFTVESATGSFDPTDPFCGDGAVDVGEECDDGNTTSNDGCDALCQNEAGPGFCGDGIPQAGEECDDGNELAGDGCDALCQLETSPAGCAAAPIDGCLVAAKASLSISEKTDGREKLKLRLARFGAATDPSAFGDPVSGPTRYDLCVYDAADALAGVLSVDRAGESCGPKQKPCFKAKGSKGWQYADPDALADGTRSLSLKGGRPGNGRAIWQAQNRAKKGQDSLPTGLTAALSGAPSATLQLVTSDAECFEAALQEVKRADGFRFEAKAN
jgi:cysteine-rich repeat protein